MSEEQVTSKEVKENIVALGMSLKKPGAARFFNGDDELKLLVDMLRIAMKEVQKREG